MQLTLHTDYALRVLIYLTQQRDDLATISEIADFYEISRNHLVKVVHHLAGSGFIETSRGKHGGMKLSRPPRQISIGEVVRHMEPNFDIVECFGDTSPGCAVTPVCKLKAVLQQAGEEFLGVLDCYSLADALEQSGATTQVFPLDQLLSH